MENSPAWPGGALVRLLPVEGQLPGAALSSDEAEAYAAFRVEKRRREWLAGRLAAKALLCAAEDRPNPAAFVVKPDHYGRPSCGDRLLSISHSGDWALAALLPGPGCFLGADIEKVEPRHPAWYRDYFHPDEIAGGHTAPEASDATRVWAIKEALLKALGLGLMADPLSIKTSGGRTVLRGPSLKRWLELGSPAFAVEARPWPGGYWTAVAAQTRAAACE
jgi:4'-phosphopantetheinyl transferase